MAPFSSHSMNLKYTLENSHHIPLNSSLFSSHPSVEYHFQRKKEKKKIEYENGKRSSKVNLGLHCSIINTSTLHSNDLLLAHNHIYSTLLFVLLANNNPRPVFIRCPNRRRRRHRLWSRHTQHNSSELSASDTETHSRKTASRTKSTLF